MKATHLVLALLLGGASAATAQQTSYAAAGKAAPTTGVARALAQEQLAWNAVVARDPAGFNKLVSPPFTNIDSDGILAWDAARSVRLNDCTTSDLALSGVRTQQPADGVVILSYQATMNQVCKGMKSPSPIYIMSVWQRQANSWKLVAHSESHAHGAR